MFKDIVGHDNVKNNLAQYKNNFPKSVIFVGPKNVGKVHTAFNYIDEIYQGAFHNRLDKHPDIYLFESDTKVFKIDLVREIKEALGTTPFELGKKYFILKNAHTMNKDSANACLKMLEDCSDKFQFILTAENIDSIIPTILSRSVLFYFYPIPNLKTHFPELTDLEIQLMGGCIGSKELFNDVDIVALNKSVDTLISSLFSLSYDQIIDWCNAKKDIDKDFLLNFMRYSCLKLVKLNKDENNNKLLKNLNNFKEKIMSSVNLDMHLKNLLIQTKYKMEHYGKK